MSEYRVIWQREGRTKQRRICQTAPGALREAERQRTAADEIEWADPPIPPLVFGPEIEVRETGPWKPFLEAREPGYVVDESKLNKDGC